MNRKFLQVNLGRGREAQDLMFQKAAEENVDILLVSEPYAKPSTYTWYEDISHRAAILVRNGNVNIREIDEDNFGFVYATLDNIRIYSCYFSPNMSHGAFATAINNLEESVRTTRGKVLIGGDFNSKSPEWNSRILDNRGILVCEMIASLGLTVFNEGQKLTFRRGSGGSIIDITIGTTSLYTENMNWMVLEDLTLSDHQYIRFYIDEHPEMPERSINLPKWNIRKLKEDKFADYILRCKQRSVRGQVESDDVESAVEFLTSTLTKACNVAMTRVRPYRNKPAVYWWNDELRELREECITARRAATRNHSDISLSLEYKRSRKTFRKAIKKSKRKCWEELCKEIDHDPWGKPYQIVRKKLGMIKPIPGIKEPERAASIVKGLFPLDMDYNGREPYQQVGEFCPLSTEELKVACTKLKVGKCPGPDGIPNTVLKLVSETWPELLINTFNLCLERCKFPDKWKIQKLVLLRKGDKPLSEPSSYRPLCMLDTLGKLFESLILNRLTQRVDELGGLSPNQYGFRKGRSTVDAINEVVQTAMEAKNSKGFCAIITLDVRNAFNTAKWSVILKAFEHRGINDYLYHIISDYLDNRILLYETDDGLKSYEVTAGVPQGSVLGPFLWNVMYDGLLNLKLQDGARLIGYADDIALVVSQPKAELIEIVTNDSLNRCNRWLSQNGLQLAVTKTEAILVTSRRKFTAPKIKLQENDIAFKRNLCYLGVQLDDSLGFGQHIDKIRNMALNTAHSLARMMPNRGGPKPRVRRLINSVVHSQLLYAAPTFALAMNQKCRIRELLKPQRISALRIISAYRTVPTSAALVIAGILPIDLQILEKEEIYNQLRRSGHRGLNPTERKMEENEIVKNARTRTLSKWQDRWIHETTGRCTYYLIPDIKEWIERTHGNVGYYMTQFLTNHGCFNQYLCRFKLRDSASCDACGSSLETANHILFECPIWTHKRRELYGKLGETITAENIIKTMLRSTEAWRYCEDFITTVIKYRSSVVPNLPR